ncbi:BA14K family protein [Ancylobacter lacus]|uniref:BA14K family protein n=1 Tax=Ancylobacter lacus TaxID=2579970 RepID=UPI001BCE3F3B|nr:BA14K family protein [Ancylobacter lacus]MBS7540141.1 BA14K family protein [Ancylobacter lacus]
MKKFALLAAAAAALMTASVSGALAQPSWKQMGPDGRPYVHTGGQGRGPGMAQRSYQPRHHAQPRYQSRNYNRGYYNRSGNHYYNGHRGYSRYRPGYQEYNGWWFPAGAFAAGALIGGAMAAQPSYAPAPGGGGHVAWCQSQYRSYRASDNTFQPYNGPRQQCVSPY